MTDLPTSHSRFHGTHVNYLIQNSQPLVLIVRQTIPVHSHPSWFFNSHIPSYFPSKTLYACYYSPMHATYLTHLILFTCFKNDTISFQHQHQKPTLKTSERWVANMFCSTHVLWFRPSACNNTFRTTPSKFCKLSNCDATCNIKIMHFLKYPTLYSKTNLYKLQNIFSGLSRMQEMWNCLGPYRTAKWLPPCLENKNTICK